MILGAPFTRQFRSERKPSLQGTEIQSKSLAIGAEFSRKRSHDLDFRIDLGRFSQIVAKSSVPKH